MSYWNQEGGWQLPSTAPWLRYKNRRRHVHPPEKFHRSASTHAFTLNSACWGITTRGKDGAKRSGVKRMIKGFHTSSLASLLWRLLQRSSEGDWYTVPVSYWHRNTQSTKMQDQRFMTLCLARSLLLAGCLSLSMSESKSSSRSSSACGGLSSCKWVVVRKEFSSEVWKTFLIQNAINFIGVLCGGPAIN